MRIPKSVCAIASLCDQMSTRYALAGVLFGRENKKPFAVATDGRRLMKASWDEGQLDEFADETPAGEGNGTQLLVSHAAVKSMAALCNGSKGSAKRLYLDESNPNVAAKYSDADTKRTVESRPLDGRFPKWQDIFCKHPPVASLNVKAGLLLDTLKAAVAVLEAKGEGGTVRLDLVCSTKNGDTPDRLEIVGEHDGKSVHAVLMGVEIEDRS